MFEELNKLSIDTKINITLLSFVICISALIIRFFFGAYMAHESGCSGAIKAGVAEYQLDKTTGTVTFQYIRPQ